MKRQSIQRVLAGLLCAQLLCLSAFPQVLGDINGDGVVNAVDAPFNFTIQIDRRKTEFVEVLLTQGGQGTLAVMSTSSLSGSGTNSGE